MFRNERRRHEQTGATYPWLVRSTAIVNHYYVYCVDRDFGPFVLKLCTYFAHNAELCRNGHEYVKHQLTNRGIGYEALHHGILTCSDPKRAQALCDGLSAHLHYIVLAKDSSLLPHWPAGASSAYWRYSRRPLRDETCRRPSGEGCGRARRLH